MLASRILETLRFFNLQDSPLTLLELHTYLLPEKEALTAGLDPQHELLQGKTLGEFPKVAVSAVFEVLNKDLAGQVECHNGFYCFKGRGDIVEQRLRNYSHGLFREKRIARFVRGLRHVPFVRGVGLAGSQVLGQQKEGSDIDLFIITDPSRMWLARTLVTAYFQVLGMRRHGGAVKNRFCLNHYIADYKKLDKHRNLYTALEYAKLRPLVYSQGIRQFHKKNQLWIKGFYPNWQILHKDEEPASAFQKFIEKAFSGGFGQWLEGFLKSWQLPKIRTEKYILVEDNELSFHPDSKQGYLLKRFFENQAEQ